MRLLNQFAVIVIITFLGELCKQVLPFPVPASIYGLVIMLFCLCTGIVKLKQVKLKQVKVAANFLIDIMPPMFIPTAVGIIVVWDQLKSSLVPIAVITVVSTVVVMVATGWVSQILIRTSKKKGANK